MSIFDFFANLFHQSGHLPTLITVKPGHYVKASLTDEQRDALFGKQAASNQHYVRIWATQMMLADNVEWFSKRYPAVYSATRLQFGNTSVDLSTVAGPKQLGNLRPADQNHSRNINQQLTGTLPFRGGVLQLDCGLVSMQSSNLLANFLNTVSDFAGKLAQPQVSAGIALAGSIATGIQSLMGASDSDTLLRYTSTFTGEVGAQTLTSGFIFLSDAPAGQYSADQLWVIEGEPRLGSSAANARSITGQNYMLLQMELLATRDDWNQLTAISQPLQKAITSKLHGDMTTANNAFIEARLAVYDSADLTDTDRKRVLTAVEQEYNGAVGLPQIASLKEIVGRAVSPAEAIHLVLPDRRSLYMV